MNACGPQANSAINRTGAILVLLLMSACVTRGTPASAGIEHLGLAIDSIATSAVNTSRVVGLSVAVLQGEVPIREEGYGTADLEASSPATDSTRYYIGSITKTITAAAIMRLAEQGRLDLDDDVVHHIPELESPGPTIRLRHLLNHTSGLAGPQHVTEKFLERRHLEFSRDQLLELLVGEPRVSALGEQYAYNNLGYVVLGLVLERVSGQSYEQHLREGVLERATAGSVLLCDPQRVIHHRATGYLVGSDTIIHHEPVNASLVFAAGGLCANAGDVARWLRALALGRVVGPEALEEMVTLRTLEDGTALPYGYGLFIDEVDGTRRIHHGGDVNGFSGHASYYPDHDLTVVVLTNTRGPAAREIEQQIARLALAQARSAR